MYATTSTGALVRYWDLPDMQIPNNSRVASVSVKFAIHNKFKLAAGIDGSPTKPVFMLVREPVSRYISALRKGPIEPNTGNHFGLQSDLAVGPQVHLYRFPEELEAFGRDTGLGPIPWMNESSAPKPSLSPRETDMVLERYAKDVELFSRL